MDDVSIYLPMMVWLSDSFKFIKQHVSEHRTQKDMPLRDGYNIASALKLRTNEARGTEEPSLRDS